MFFMVIMMSMLLLNNLMILSSHPLMMTLLILVQTLLVCLMLGNISYSYWFSYVLFLILLGGMLVLFMYITSLASNDMFIMINSIKKTYILMMTFPFMLTFYYLFHTSNYNYLKSDTMNNLMLNELNENPLNLNNLYNNPNNNIMLLSIIYLLVTLIIVVYITKINKGPLRKFS